MKRSERQFVEKLRRQAQHSAQQGTQQSKALRRVSRVAGKFVLGHGIGDDCAVISSPGGPPNDLPNDLLVTTDLFLEGVHFRREWQPADSVGYKVLLRGLSDIAAMGGAPRFAFLSLGLPPQVDWRWADEFFGGFFRLAEKTGVVLAGGDIGASPSGMVADIMVIGEVPRGTAVLRSRARPGDAIWVSGALGGAARALDLLRKSGKVLPRKTVLRPLFYPSVRLELGQQLRERGLASAMMDLSDGLSIDLARLCQSSGVGARIEEAAIPRAIAPGGAATLPMALHGGEDFELLFTVPPAESRRIPGRLGGVPLTRIGEITKGKALCLIRKKTRGKTELPLPVLGFEHF